MLPLMFAFSLFSPCCQNPPVKSLRITPEAEAKLPSRVFQRKNTYNTARFWEINVKKKRKINSNSNLSVKLSMKDFISYENETLFLVLLYFNLLSTGVRKSVFVSPSQCLLWNVLWCGVLKLHLSALSRWNSLYVGISFHVSRIFHSVHL